MQIINLEAGMPTVETARTRLSQELRIAKVGRVRFVKIIHGYGSTGKGGAIKLEVHRFLLRKKREGFIRDFAPGEEFTPFDDAGRRVVALEPKLKGDRDFSRQNDGITIVVI